MHIFMYMLTFILINYKYCVSVHRGKEIIRLYTYTLKKVKRGEDCADLIKFECINNRKSS